MNYFKNHEDAYKAAVKKAKAANIDVGIEKSDGGYIIRYLPKPENRYGWDLRCEVVTPSRATNEINGDASWELDQKQ